MKKLDLASLGAQADFIFMLRFTKNLQQKAAKSALKMGFETASKLKGDRHFFSV